MKKLSLVIGERIMLQRVINEAGDNITRNDLRFMLKILEKASLDETEIKLVNYRIQLSKDGARQTSHWDNVTYTKDIDFGDDEYKLILRIIKERDVKKRFSLADGKYMLNLCNKIESNDEKTG